MSELVAIAYPDERQGVEAMATMKRLQAQGVIDLDEALAAAKDGEGRIRLEGAISRAGSGARGGLVLGTLVGLVFFVPVIGALFGAAGALAGSFVDAGRMDDFTTQFGDRMPPGSSAVLMLVPGPAADPVKILAELRRYGGTVIRTTLPDDAEARLRATLDQPTADAA